MNIFVIGITGFIGYPAALELLRRGHSVAGATLALPKGQPPLPQDAAVILGNINALDEDAFAALLAGKDVLVFAAGADDRVTTPAPACPCFYRANVANAVRIFTLARCAAQC